MESADEGTLRAMRTASPALQDWWANSESPPRSWKGVTWSDDRVLEIDLQLCRLEVLPPQIGQLQALISLDLSGCLLVKLLPPQVGQLQALTSLRLGGCKQLTLAPGAETDQPVATIIAAYARLLIVEPRKDTPGQLLAFLEANPLAVPAFFNSILTDVIHADWLGKAVKATPSLTELTVADGRRAIDVAHSAEEGAVEVYRQMRLPLHNALEEQAPEAVVRRLMEADPKQTKTTDEVCGGGAPFLSLSLSLSLTTLRALVPCVLFPTIPIRAARFFDRCTIATACRTGTFPSMWP